MRCTTHHACKCILKKLEMYEDALAAIAFNSTIAAEIAAETIKQAKNMDRNMKEIGLGEK